jgi:hypothetical protein
VQRAARIGDRSLLPRRRAAHCPPAPGDGAGLPARRPRADRDEDGDSRDNATRHAPHRAPGLGSHRARARRCGARHARARASEMATWRSRSWSAARRFASELSAARCQPRVRDSLGRPSRVPITADAALFRNGVELGFRVIWLQADGSGRDEVAIPSRMRVERPVGATTLSSGPCRSRRGSSTSRSAWVWGGGS